ncbi:hypothetical protein CCR97_07965 [Rhodoplanes elegans]|uniref:HNH nuclease domain-containing protein n=1 Tax=Rhodoplanes elegans TaxID=29408 RepID=A0A327KRW7_9BRAD|nr:hypothetical protein [Rhodoplanes elegans]MBK5958054.1 hypothetical protein [Rhodoplanes elegans]MBK5958146.1 hypothetical protein [Rhodoplanes elegans]RAI40433.1 hypothetical protein CH338_06215 [Rhodoplanes elegans]
MTDVSTTQRRKLSPRERLAIFERAGGVCCCCGGKIEAGDGWIVEHPTALGLGGSDDRGELRPAHKACADAKTYGPDGDLATIARAKRRKAKHLGIRKPSRFPCSRDSRWKKRMDGSVVLRD